MKYKIAASTEEHELQQQEHTQAKTEQKTTSQTGMAKHQAGKNRNN